MTFSLVNILLWLLIAQKESVYQETSVVLKREKLSESIFF